jgi:hypothetical protein
MERGSTNSGRGREIDAVRAEVRRFTGLDQSQEQEIAPEAVAARALATERVREAFRARQSAPETGSSLADRSEAAGDERRGRAARLPLMAITRGEINFF